MTNRINSIMIASSFTGLLHIAQVRVAAADAVTVVSVNGCVFRFAEL
jgi:hypothetical protein